MLRHIQSRSDSPTALYVDDFIVLTLVGRGVVQQKLVGDTINDTFPGADSEEKRRIPGPVQEVLGWDADLRSATVNPNIKGREKLLLYFFTFNTNRPHSIKEWKRLASLAERYSTGVCGMRDMVAPLQNTVAE